MKRLHVPKKLGARLKVKQHRPLEGTPKTAHLVLRADGHWYVLIVCDIGEAPEKREGDAIGLDLGAQESPSRPRYRRCELGRFQENPRAQSGRSWDAGCGSITALHVATVLPVRRDCSEVAFGQDARMP
jgi:hypothetical protein